MNRRTFLVGFGALVTGATSLGGARRWWQVPAGGPVPSRGLFDDGSLSRDFSWLRDGPLPHFRRGPSGAECRFPTSREVYAGGMVAVDPNCQTVSPCRFSESPIGVVQSIELDGSAWVRMGDPSEVCWEVERKRAAERLGYTPVGMESPDTRAAREALGGSFDGAPLFGNEHLPLTPEAFAHGVHRSYDEAVISAIDREARTVTTTSWELPDAPEARALFGADPRDFETWKRETFTPVSVGYGEREPIGTIESIDTETGIATVRLGGPLRGWRGAGVA